MAELDKNSFAKQLQKARKDNNMTVDQLAESVSKSRNTISQMEAAERFTSIPTLIVICNTLNISPDYLLSVYLKDTSSKNESEYQKIINLIFKLKPNELKILTGIIELMLKNRD